MKYDANRLGNGKKTMTAEQIEQYVEENAGTEYTAGEGISIVDNVISAINTEVTEVPYTEWDTLVEEVDDTHFKFKSDIIITLKTNADYDFVESICYSKNFNLLKDKFKIPSRIFDLQSASFSLINWFGKYSSFINTESTSLVIKREISNFIKGATENSFTYSHEYSDSSINKSFFKIVKLN